MSMFEEKVFFTAGDEVELKQDLPYKPVMVVRSVDKVTSTGMGQKPILLGVTCFWFTDSMLYQEKRFNTKDLIERKK